MVQAMQFDGETPPHKQFEQIASTSPRHSSDRYFVFRKRRVRSVVKQCSKYFQAIVPQHGLLKSCPVPSRHAVGVGPVLSNHLMPS